MSVLPILCPYFSFFSSVQFVLYKLPLSISQTKLWYDLVLGSLLIWEKRVSSLLPLRADSAHPHSIVRPQPNKIVMHIIRCIFIPPGATHTRTCHLRFLISPIFDLFSALTMSQWITFCLNPSQFLESSLLKIIANKMKLFWMQL